MMKFVLVLLGALFPLMLPAQTVLWIDLTGEWRTIEGDDPRYASADFDDSTWRTIRLPVGRGAWGSQGWLRRTITLPEAPQAAEPLSFTTGSIPGTWELYVNGKLAGSTGPNPIVGRPTTIQLPPGQKPGGKLVLAFRLYSDRGPAAWRITDSGPWVLTSASVAPRDLERTTLGMQKLLRLGELVEPLILVCLAVVVLLIWISQRSERKLLWLGAYLLAVAGGRLNLFWQIGPDPLLFPDLSLGLALRTLPAAILAHFVSAWTGIRWHIWPVWILAALGVMPPSALAAYVGIWGIIAITLTVLAEHLWRTRRDYLLCAGAVVVVYLHAGSWTNLRETGFPVLVQTNFGNWIPFALVWHMLAVTVFGFAMTLVLVRRLIRDRDEKVRLSGELEAARTVQQLLLPSVSASTERFVSDAVYQPAQEVGGDFYWTRVEPGGTLIVVVGDVSGKGLKAAMLVSVVVGILRTVKESSPSAILEALNDGLTGHTGGGFVTSCCARFDASGSVTLANAGHPSPYCDGREVEVEAGLPLGVMAGVAYEESVVSGERFTFVSDGVVEAENAQRELFGFDRTREISTKPAQEIADAAKAWGQNDDITVVTVRRNA